MKLIFVTEKHVDCILGKPLTNSFHNLFGSLESTGLAEFECLHYDEYASTHEGNRIDDYLLERCRDYKPDAVFFSYYQWAHWGVMLTETLEAIKTMGIKTIFIWWDGMGHIRHDLADLMISACDDITPQDPRLYNDPGMERDIDVYFCGTIYSERPHFLNYITANLAHKVRFMIAAGQRGSGWSAEQYAEGFKRCKIALNFCTGGQVKGRVFEAAHCGACLFEQDNPRIKTYFEPFVEYVPFGSPADLSEKIDYYLAHDDERIKIAQAGKEKCEKAYNAKIWWNKVLSAIS